MMNAEDFKVFKDQYVEVSWFEGGPQSACGFFQRINGEDVVVLDWEYGEVSIFAPQFQLKMIKESPVK